MIMIWRVYFVTGALLLLASIVLWLMRHPPVPSPAQVEALQSSLDAYYASEGQD